MLKDSRTAVGIVAGAGIPAHAAPTSLARSSSSARRQRRAAAGVVVIALAIITVGAAWERTHARGIADALADGGDDVVVARVPARGADAGAREVERLRATLRATPLDLAAATRLARLDVTAARDRADPRFLGRAEAALAPWWDRPDPPAEVVLLRATIRQARHDFEPALADLDALVARPPATVGTTTLVQAWLTRAVVLGVKARYADALASCARLDELATPFVRAACRAPLLGLTGKATVAATELVAVLDRASSAAEVAWARSLLADLARAAGDDHGAEALLRSVLAVAPTDGLARATLADLLLDGGRSDEVAALVAGHEEDDALLLRLALAQAQGPTPIPPRPASAAPAALQAGPATAAAMMAARFRASRERGDVVHRREEARFALAVERDPARALGLAVANWEVQREPADARVLLEAALAAGVPAAARPALEWMNATNLAWPPLRELAAALRSAS